MNASPRIGIIGAGAIGGFYGLMLARAGFDVHFLLRSEFDAVARQGLQLNSAVHGALSLHPGPRWCCCRTAWGSRRNYARCCRTACICLAASAISAYTAAPRG